MVDNVLIKKAWKWFDNYFLLLATSFLIVFIPLYPKIPLADIIPGYIVRLRLEDVFIAITFGWWLTQILRRKISWKTPLTWLILAYLGIGLLSNVLGVLVTKTIPAELLHFGKSTMHWLRHIQYFSLFFMAYAAVKTKRHGQILIWSMIVALLGVVVYGFGQKYYYWPVYSTMNREFSKGVRLYLGEYARAQSTFAGHYDLGAYLVTLLSMALALYFYLGQKIKEQAKQLKRLKIWRLAQLTLAAAWFSGLWLLVLSASRTSFGGFLLGAGLIVLLYMLRRGWWWGISRGFSVLLISAVMMFTVGDLATRFEQVINKNRYPWLSHAFHITNDLRKNPEKVLVFLPDRNPPEGGMSTDDLEAELNKQGLTASDTRPSTERPSDVYTDVPEKEFDLDDPDATGEAGLIQEGDKLVKKRVYSDCSLEHSLSVCIRIETLWPRAIDGFLKNPLVGSGYATLNKESFIQFTEAESTDNNFLRTLGENGALGFFFYYATMAMAIWYSWLVYRRTNDNWLRSLAIANIAGTVGLLLNAMYIDVFVASKVAYTFWTLQGVLLALFVKEGVIAPQYAFDRQRRQSDAANLSKLLAQAEQKAENKTAKSKYLSKKKRSQKSKKAQIKKVRRQ